MTNVFKRKGVRVLLLLALTGASLSFTTASEPVDCKQKLLAAYRKLADQGDATRAVYHLQFESTTAYRTPSKQTKQETTVHGELYSRGTKTFFKTDNMSLWQDGQYVAAVLHAQHTILLTRSVPGKPTLATHYMPLLRDSLIQLGKIQRCTNEQRGKQMQQHIQLTYSEAAATKLKIKALDFWLTPQNTLYQVNIQYQPTHPAQQITLRFPVQEWLTTSAKLPNDARSQVVDPAGKLLPAYQGYKLVNQISLSH
jgi:hypothetical protein